MTEPQSLYAGPVWQAVTRLGEAQILIPVAVLMMLVFAAQPESRRFALRWLALTTVAALVTTASKLAFLGWGWGFAEFNFTGISGHSMFAAAIYPVLMVAVMPARLWAGSRFGLALGLALGGGLAVLVGLSRLVVGAHSQSEVLAGLLLGGAASALAIARASPVDTTSSTTASPSAARLSSPLAAHLHPVVPVILVVWFMWTPFELPDSQTHSWVIRLALTLSGRDAPFTRSQLFENGASLQ
jgi:membrane-associated phospholipid phosphatase